MPGWRVPMIGLCLVPSAKISVVAGVGSKHLFKNRSFMTALGRKTKPSIILYNPIYYIPVQSANTVTAESEGLTSSSIGVDTLIGRFFKSTLMTASTTLVLPWSFFFLA